jgi:hypothetical protein
MGKFYPSLACLLHVLVSGCMDYVKVEDDSTLGETHQFAPIIDAEHLSPHPSRFEEISVGKNCKGQVFAVPPIEDLNKKDLLYYLWFIDNKLIVQSLIEPASRDAAIITLTIDEQLLLSFFEREIRRDFFKRRHIIDFYVSDVEYAIPETRLTKNPKVKENEHSAHVYWVVTFSNDQC